MQSARTCAVWAALLVPAAIFAQTVTTEGTLAVAAGGTLLQGDRPALQQIIQQKKDGYGGIEEFRLTRESEGSSFKFDTRLLPGNDDYRVAIRYEKGESFYADAGFEQFRVWYDGSGGRFRPTDTSFVMFDEDLSLTRNKLWAEVGAYTANKTLLRLRYERKERDGTKSSTYWGDSNLVGTFGTRSVVPSFYDVRDVTNVFTFDVGNESQVKTKWNVGARYAETELNDRRFTRRRPFETADRIVTTKDETKTDIFTVHGYYLRQIGEKLTLSGGALRTKLDSNLEGSRIYGQSYDPVYDPAYVRRQQRDEGFYNLEGSAQIRQTVLNLNAVYIPKKDWSLRPSIRFENLRQDAVSDFIETNIGAGPAFAAIIDEVEGDNNKKWNEFSEGIEVRYTGMPDWTFSGKGEWVQGSGNLDEKLVLETGVAAIDREIDYDRTSQKYSLSANWYAKPGLTFAAQYYFKGNVNDYDAKRDSTPDTGGDRYPSYITDQDFETHDVNVRMAWRPFSPLNLVTRYDNQRSQILTGGAGLALERSAKLTSHIISQNVTWSPAGRIYVNGTVNVTYDQVESPARAFVQNGDNNYVNGSLGAGCAVAKRDDVYLDYTWFRAENFIDNSALSLPYGVGLKTQAANLTWVRRQSEHLIYTVKYRYITNRDETWAGLNNFDAHVLYANVQYRF